MPYRVIHQVRHQAFRQPRISCGRGFSKPGLHVDAPARRFLAADRDHVPGDRGQVKGFPLLDAALAGGQGKQRLDQVFLLIA